MYDCVVSFSIQQCEYDWGSVLFGTLFGGIGAAGLLFLFYRKYKQVRIHDELHVQLLAESQQEVAELEAAWSIDPTDLVLDKPLGAGGFGHVHLAYWKSQDRCAELLCF